MKTAGPFSIFTGKMCKKIDDIVAVYPKDLEGEKAVLYFQKWKEDYGIPSSILLVGGEAAEDFEADIPEPFIVVVVGDDGLVDEIYSKVDGVGREAFIYLDSNDSIAQAYFHFAEPLLPLSRGGEVIEASKMLYLIENSQKEMSPHFGFGLSRGGCYVSFPHKEQVTNFIVDLYEFCTEDPHGMFSLYEAKWLPEANRFIRSD